MPSSNNSISDSNSIVSGVDDLQNPKFNYNGNFDKQGFRNGYGSQTWDQPFRHEYSGYFLLNNMHNNGFYFIKQEDDISFYNGQFYNNKLEGYGQVIFDDGKIHEGLFKENRRFGPGVLTYPDDTQDVGLWNGNYLIRLSISISSNIVPSLCNNPEDKMKLLRYKTIVPALGEKKDLAKELMSELTNDEYSGPMYSELYNPHVRNENSLFFDRRLYDLSQLGSEDTLIEVLEDDVFLNDIISNVIDAEDENCPCIDQRCTRIIEQLSEIEMELKIIQEKRRKVEGKLKINNTCSENCDCCSSLSNRGKELTDNYDNEPKTFEVDNDNFLLKKNSESVDDVVAKEVDKNLMYKEIMNKMLPGNQRKTSSIDRIFIRTNTFSSDLSSNNSEKDELLVDTLKNQTCTYMNDEALQNADHLRGELGKLLKEETFYITLIEFLNRVLQKEFSSVTRKYSSRTIKLPVENLLTWNNGKTIIEILQHSFKYRNFEGILNFNIKSLLTGERTAFGKTGKIENNCIRFLKHCANNDLNEIQRDLFYHNVHPDLSDARGNTGLHLAVTCDRHEVIKQLANVGANLDIFNDECITPLILGILRYISALNRVVFWDRAFLSELLLSSEELDEVTQWRPHESLISLGEYAGSLLSNPKSDHQILTSQEFTSNVRNHIQSNKQGFAKNSSYLFSTAFIDDVEDVRKAEETNRVEEFEKMNNHMVGTIERLLQYGADPNIGDLPMKPVLLAIFSRNVKIIEDLLRVNANPNSVTEENLTSLHILASQPFNSINVQIAKKFLSYSSDPNTKTPKDFWIEQNEELKGTYINTLADGPDNQGKTPLQMAVMRKDFDENNVNYQCDFVKLLIEYGAVHDEYFLGHTLISLSVLRGNNRLIETLHSFVEIGQPLGENMGNALTVLGLQRFPYVTPFDTCKCTIQTLISLGLNPFNTIYNFPNIFEFFHYDHAIEVDFDIPRIRARLEANEASLRRVLNTKSNIQEDCNKLTIVFLKEIARDILVALYRYEAVQILIDCASVNMLNNQQCLVNMAKFFSIDEALDYIKLRVYRNKIILDADYEKNVLKVLNFIKVNTAKTTNMPLSASKSPMGLEDEVKKLKKNYEVPQQIANYVMDSNPDKYEVCFHCLRKSNKRLLPCSSCGLVKFCSEMCNKYNNKMVTKHPCKIIFYDEANRIYGQPSFNSSPTVLLLQMMEAEKKRRKESEIKEHSRKFQEKKSRSRSLIPSIGSSPRKKMPKNPIVCCKKPSSIFICDSKAHIEQRKINCGFHCGLLFSGANIVGEEEFCECYPLHGSEATSLFNRKEIILNQEDSMNSFPNQENSSDSSPDGAHKVEKELKSEPTNFDEFLIDDGTDKNGVLSLKKALEQEGNTLKPPTEVKNVQGEKLSSTEGSEILNKEEISVNDGQQYLIKDMKSSVKNQGLGKKRNKKESQNDSKIKSKKQDQIEIAKKNKKKIVSNELDEKKERQYKERNKRMQTGKNFKGKNGSEENKWKKNVENKLKNKKSRNKRTINEQKDISKRTNSEERVEKKGTEKDTDHKTIKKSVHTKNKETFPTVSIRTDRQIEKTEKNTVDPKSSAHFEGLGSKVPNAEKDFRRITRAQQYFLELLAKYFPDFDMTCSMQPFACFIDGQMYYKFADMPFYCRTYSTI